MEPLFSHNYDFCQFNYVLHIIMFGWCVYQKVYIIRRMFLHIDFLCIIIVLQLVLACQLRASHVILYRPLPVYSVAVVNWLVTEARRFDD